MKFIKLIFIFSFFLYPIFFTGCEKEIGDIIPADINNSFEGEYIFSVYGELNGNTVITVNNRGGFSFFIPLKINGIPAYTVTVTGIVNENGALQGSIFKAQADYGYLSGQLGSGNFVMQDGSYTINCTYGATRN